MVQDINVIYVYKTHLFTGKNGKERGEGEKDRWVYHLEVILPPMGPLCPTPPPTFTKQMNHYPYYPQKVNKYKKCNGVSPQLTATKTHPPSYLTSVLFCDVLWALPHTKEKKEKPQGNFGPLP